jgi:hypothetical protein
VPRQPASDATPAATVDPTNVRLSMWAEK